ncbi:hypothetical protein PGT21_012824 [Puccinia graminis f. sp. tritici]|uniref:DUF6818 domain-containing protein n=1 Tax=Puccinia graminis f. sp. tritici TaxID=56615 RepID=A0A5B0LJF3_PUCGR|nr:hypothetical protein PGT21_012824 [Puccinia graminis f. sp. tritici]
MPILQAQAGPRSQNPRPSGSGQQSTRGGRGSTNSLQKHAGGCAPGSQGYLQADCKALNHCVRQILPLGSQEWSKVQALYNQWAIANDQSERKADPLKTKFRTMVHVRKPTGKTVCPPGICEAKEIKVLIRERAVHNTVVDSLGNEENESADERNGIGAEVGQDEEQDPAQSYETLSSGWTETQPHANQSGGPQDLVSSQQFSQQVGAENKNEMGELSFKSDGAFNDDPNNNRNSTSCPSTPNPMFHWVASQRDSRVNSPISTANRCGGPGCCAQQNCQNPYLTT